MEHAERNGVPEAVADWMAGRLTPPGRARLSVVGAVGLREGGSPWKVRFDDGSAVVVRIADPHDAQRRDGFRTEAYLLETAERYGIPTSRLLALDVDGSRTGSLALVSSLLEGGSRIPVKTGAKRLRAYGAATALVHRVPGEAVRDALPRRVRPIEPVDFAAMRRGGADVSALMTAGDAAVAARPVPDREPVLVHGDLWQGNTLFAGDDADEFAGFVDWDCAGVGEAGLDVASVRLDADLMFGAGHADVVLDGYLAAGGMPEVPDLAYWDVVAALATPVRMAEFESVIQDQGRPDLDRAILESRRNAFLQAALERL